MGGGGWGGGGLGWGFLGEGSSDGGPRRLVLLSSTFGWGRRRLLLFISLPNALCGFDRTDYAAGLLSGDLTLKRGTKM